MRDDHAPPHHVVMVRGTRVWRDHADMGKERPAFGGSPQLLLYEDALVARDGSTVVSLLPRVGD
jgi:hypothetical protein